MKVLGILPIPWDSAPNGGLCPWCWYPTGPSWCWTVCPSCMVREGLSFHPPGFKSWRPHGPGHSVDSPYLLHLLSPEPFVRDCSRRGQVSGQQRPAICSGASPSSPWFRAFWAWPAARNPGVSSTASGTHRQSAHRSVHDSRSFSYLIHPEASHLALQTCADWSILMAGVLFLGPILSPRRKSLPGSL